MTAYLELHALIAAEFHILLPESAPLYQIQHTASLAENRRNARIKAAEKGQMYIG